MKETRAIPTSSTGRKIRTALVVLASALFVLALLAVLLWVYVAYEPPLSRVEKQVHAALRQMIAAGERETDLVRLAEFPWDKACMVRPYTRELDLNEAIGTSTRGYDSIAWINDEQYWTLVFVSANELIPVRIPRMDIGDYQLPREAWAACIPRSGARLTWQADKTELSPPRTFQFQQH